MPATAAAPPPPAARDREAERLLARLASVRRRYRFVTALTGVCHLLVATLPIMLVVSLLDWHYSRQEFDPVEISNRPWKLVAAFVYAVMWGAFNSALLRPLPLVIILITAGLVGYRKIMRPLRRRMDNMTLALQIEDRYPSLNDSLATAVQFIQDPTVATASPGMRGEAIRRSLNKSRGVDFLRILDTGNVRRLVVLALVSAVLYAGFFWYAPVVAQTALLRLADPFGEHHWTVVELDPGRDSIGRNEAYEVNGTVRGIIPENVTVKYRVAGGAAVDTVVSLHREEGADVATFNVPFRPGQMQSDFEYCVKTNGMTTEWRRVKVLPPPILVKLGDRASPQLRLEYPAYTEKNPVWLPDGNGNLDVIAGTVVTLRAAANRPLRRAWVEYRPDPLALHTTAGLLPLTSAGSLDAAALAAVAENIYAPHMATLDGERTGFSVRFAPVVSGYYRLYFEDETGLHNERVYEVRVHTDPAPVVALVKPGARFASLEVMPTAVLRLEAVAEDPIFGLRALWVEYRCDEEPARRVPLLDPERTAARLVLGQLSWPGAGVGLEPLRPQRHVVERDLALTLLRHADGGPLRPGDVVTLRVCGDDYDNVTWDKPPGQSNEVEIRIVSQPTLELALHQEQAKVQQELTELRALEREAMKKVVEVENRVARTGKLTPEDLVELARAEQMQQQLRERLGNREQESVQTRVERIRETLRQNNMTHSAVQDRMELVGREIDRLGRKELEQIEARLNAARKLGEVPEAARPQKQAELLEQQAEQLDKAARQAEAGDNDAEARKKEAAALREQARRLRELAEQVRRDPDGAGAEARKQEAERLAAEEEKQAKELADKADMRGPREKELLQEAKALRESARALHDMAEQRAGGDEKALKGGLADARRGQEEVEKTLGGLLQRLEPWSSSREVKAELRALLEEQRRQLEELEAMQKEFVGRDLSELTPEQKARLDTAAANQQKLRERTQELLDKMRRLAADRQERDPETARELEQAREKATEADITGEMQRSREELEKDHLANAAKSAKAARDRLKDLVKQLEDRREAELDRMIKKQRETEKALLELLDEGERLKKKIKEAEAIKDPQQRAAALKKLAGEQQALKEKTEEMARQLSRLRNDRGAEALNDAARQMDEQVRRLERGEVDKDKQEEGLDRLDEALEEVEKARADNEDELTREQLARIAETLQKLKERQEGLGAEGERIYKETQKEGTWSRGLLISLGGLSRAETELARDTKSTAEDELKGAAVVQRLVTRAAEAMERAGKRFDEQRAAVLTDVKNVAADEPARQAQAEALRRLQQILDAVKQEAEAGPRASGGGGGGGGGGSRGPEGDGIPALAQLKLLRTMQADVNRRTQEFAKKYPDADKLTPEQKVELESIQREQREVAELIEEMIPKTGEGAGR